MIELERATRSVSDLTWVRQHGKPNIPGADSLSSPCDPTCLCVTFGSILDQFLLNVRECRYTGYEDRFLTFRYGRMSTTINEHQYAVKIQYRLYCKSSISYCLYFGEVNFCARNRDSIHLCQVKQSVYRIE